MVKGAKSVKSRNLRTFLFPTVHERIVQCDKDPKDEVPLMGGTKKIRRAGFAFVHRFR
jgi:hypothetical protein